ncbi:MAG TPA: alpha/beta hydrolase [Kouleothrix sp.]|uniref:alpha/beta fold hydrolase n=1 Tax=Kouleothrix sp. TaxID=2779161 RepID=UPI002B9AAF02|nr:alpha/beta hydrolase [Kouleothrix sp.]
MATSMTESVPAARRTRVWRHGARKILLWIAAGALALTSTLLVAGAAAKSRIRAQYPPTGQLVDIGGYRLHLSCQGSGGPTVILEAGGGSIGLDWSLVQPAIAQQARVCVYDRAGLGWSDASPQPRTAAAMAGELHSLLERAGVAGPYVLVGHSLGGPIIRQYALAHPSDVAGMVLVDSATEQQSARFPTPINAAMAGAPRLLRLMSLAGDAGLLALLPAIVPVSGQLPADAAAAAHALTIASGKTFRTFLAEMQASDADPTARTDSLGDIPLVVVRHGRAVAPIKGDVTPEVAREYEQVWAQMQAELAALSPRGRVVVAAESGHAIHADQPDVVIAAIREVLAAAR